MEKPEALSELDPQIKIRSPLRCDGIGSLDCAEHLESGMRMAVRWLPLNANGAAAAEAVLQLPAHPTLPTIRQTGRNATAAYVAMDFPEGQLLATQLGEKMEPQAWCQMGAEIADALATIHAQGVFHGELSADSLLLAPQQKAILWDMPLVVANRLTDRRGEEREMASTVRMAPYLAPERAQGMPPSGASDVYALGSALCLAAGGRPPAGATTLAVIHQIASGQWSPEVPEDCSPEVRKLLSRMVSRDPLLRPSAREVARVLAKPLPVAPTVPEIPAVRISAETRKVVEAAKVARSLTPAHGAPAPVGASVLRAGSQVLSALKAAPPGVSVASVAAKVAPGAAVGSVPVAVAGASVGSVPVASGASVVTAPMAVAGASVASAPMALAGASVASVPVTLAGASVASAPIAVAGASVGSVPMAWAPPPLPRRAAAGALDLGGTPMLVEPAKSELGVDGHAVSRSFAVPLAIGLGLLALLGGSAVLALRGPSSVTAPGALVAAPVSAPVVLPVVAPVAAPVVAPVSEPVVAPVAAPVAAPVVPSDVAVPVAPVVAPAVAAPVEASANDESSSLLEDTEDLLAELPPRQVRPASSRQPKRKLQKELPAAPRAPSAEDFNFLPTGVDKPAGELKRPSF